MEEHRRQGKGRGTTVLISLLASIVIVSLLYLFLPVTVSTSISLQFEGIDKGKNPDDTRFDYTELVSAEVIERIFTDIGVEYNEAFAGQFHAKPVLPGNIVDTIKKRRAAGEDYTYFPNEFVISVTPDRSIGLSESICEAAIRQYSTSYESYFKENYTFPFMDLDKLVNNFDFDTYDYPEYETVFNNEFSIISSYLNILERDDPEFVSSENLTFSDLKEGLSLTKRLDISKMSSIINSYHLSKDTEKLKIKYLYMIRRYTLEKNRETNNYTISQTLLDIVKQNDATVIVPGMSGESYTYSALNDTYDTIVSQVTDAQVSSVNYDEEINYLNQKIYELDNPIYSDDTIGTAKNDVNTLALDLMTKIRSWVTRITDTATEYFDYKYDNMLSTVYLMRVNRVLSLTKAIVLAVVLWIVMIAFGAKLSYKNK